MAGIYNIYLDKNADFFKQLTITTDVDLTNTDVYLHHTGMDTSDSIATDFKAWFTSTIDKTIAFAISAESVARLVNSRANYRLVLKNNDETSLVDEELLLKGAIFIDGGNKTQTTVVN